MRRFVPLLALAACQADPPAPTSGEILQKLLGEADPNAGIEERPPLPFESLRALYDSNADWVLVPDELPERDWQRFDRNLDGRLTLDDFPAESGALTERVERALDARLALPALRDALPSASAFAALDVDKDGALVRIEVADALPAAPGERDAFSALLALVRSWDDDALSIDEWRSLHEWRLSVASKRETGAD